MLNCSLGIVVQMGLETFFFMNKGIGWQLYSSCPPSPHTPLHESTVGVPFTFRA